MLRGAISKPVYMKLYENVVIGNFLYGLGFAIAKRTTTCEFPAIVNLLQQTPDDSVLGDLLFEAPGLLRIIEFKQRSNTDPKEDVRYARLCLGLTGSPAMTHISRQVHWFVETQPTHNHFIARIVPYLDAFPRTDEQHDFAAFIAATAEAAVNEQPQSSFEEMNAYLGWLASLHKSGTISSGGLVVKLSPDGTLHYVALVSVMELVLSRQSIRQEREQAMALEKARRVSHKQRIELQRQHEYE